LERLVALHAAGGLTDAEFAATKAQVMSNHAPEELPSVVRLLDPGKRKNGVIWELQKATGLTQLDAIAAVESASSINPYLVDLRGDSVVAETLVAALKHLGASCDLI